MKRSSLMLAISAVVIAVLAIFFIVHKDKEQIPSAAKSHYGVADLETLVKAHPAYSEYFKLEMEYNQLLSQYQTDRKKLIDSSIRQKAVTDRLSDVTRRMAAEDELKTKVKAKEDELNNHLNDLYKDIEKKHTAKTGDYTLFGSLTPEERTEMANLQIKLTILGVTGEEKEQIKNRLHELMELRTARGSMDMSAWTPEEVQEMTEAKKKAQDELDEYSRRLAEEIRHKIAEEKKINKAEIEESFAESHKEWDQTWKDRIKNKQEQMAEVKKEIMADIEKEAARLASEKHLDMIFSRYKANVNAEDVTGDLASRIISIKR